MMPVACASGALKVRFFLVGLVLLIAPNLASAQPVEVPPTWGGDFWSRPRLTGDWDGLRDELGKKGVVFDLDLLLTPQSVVSGGRNTGTNFWGNSDYTLNVDTDKLGLWPGGFFKFSADSGFGSNSQSNSGALVPINTAALIPAPNDETTALMNATFMQFFSTKFGLFAGKINLFDPAIIGQEFYGAYSTQFLNAAFMFLMTLEQTPISAFGGGVIAFPWEDVALSALVVDPDGTPTSNDLGNAFSAGVTVVGTGKLTVRPFGLVGHQNVGMEWSNKEHFSFDQDPSNLAKLFLDERFPRLGNPGPILTNILGRFFPNLLVPAQPANRTNSTWTVYYGFDQYFWQPEGDPKHGIGMFFSFGASDGNPNPIQYAFMGGSAARAWSRADRMTPSALASHGPSSAALSCPSCANTSTSASNKRTRSRCTTTPRSRNRST
jgi:porin